MNKAELEIINICAAQHASKRLIEQALNERRIVCLLPLEFTIRNLERYKCLKSYITPMIVDGKPVKIKYYTSNVSRPST